MKLFILLILSLINGAFANELVIYSARNEQLIKPLFDLYKKETGTTISFVTDKEGPLMQKLKTEGANSPADILLTVDAGNLWLASKEGLLQPIKSKILSENIPAHLRDPENFWVGLSVRARTIFYNKDKVKITDLSSYEDLALPKWNKRLCLRTSNKVYNQSLVAMMIAENGEAPTEKIVAGWVKNLATTVFPDDTKLIEAIDAGLCDVGIANTYYFGKYAATKPTAKVGLFWPNQKKNGVHVNVSGAGITKYSKNPEAALKFIEWLSSSNAQNLFVDENYEFPVNSKIKSSPVVAAWGKFKQNVINVSKAGELQSTAVKLMDRAQYK
ncbi:MAG: extracellular solute-binding protein [Bacteriovoracaceae bacterium]|nr:extracellular solute-binding protein [Bacteriovoracaceae bacterium]